MTRDEAVAAFNGIENPGSFGTKAWIDRFVALGMLKLEKTVEHRERFVSALVDRGYLASSPGMKDALEAYDEASRTPQESDQ